MNCIKTQKDGLELLIRLTPKAGRNQVGEEHNGRLKVSVTSPPVDGKANAHLIKLLSKKLRIPKSSIEFTSGETSRNKTLKIRGTTLEDAANKLGL